MISLINLFHSFLFQCHLGSISKTKSRKQMDFVLISHSYYILFYIKYCCTLFMFLDQNSDKDLPFASKNLLMTIKTFVNIQVLLLLMMLTSRCSWYSRKSLTMTFQIFQNGNISETCHLVITHQKQVRQQYFYPKFKTFFIAQ